MSAEQSTVWWLFFQAFLWHSVFGVCSTWSKKNKSIMLSLGVILSYILYIIYMLRFVYELIEVVVVR